jgi:hypothetical protein
MPIAEHGPRSPDAIWLRETALRQYSGFAAARREHQNRQSDQLCCQRREPIVMAGRPAILHSGRVAVVSKPVAQKCDPAECDAAGA